MKRQLGAIADWLELTDYGYGLGLLLYLFSMGALLAAGLVSLWGLVPAGVLLVLAFVLCWWFG